MTEQQLQALGPALADFLDQFLFCCGYTQTFAHLLTYVRGLLPDLPRKSVEPIALQAGTPARTLQEFLKDHAWDFAAVRDRLQRHAAAALPALPDDGVGVVGLIDETSAVKQGAKTPGVQRQYLGCIGKVDNGVVTVHLGACKGRSNLLLDGDLYLPESWSDDRPRCRAAGIPDAVVYRPKWQIALEQLDRAVGNGVRLDWLTFDEEYGKRPGFVAGLDQRQLRFVGEVPRSFACRAAHRSGRRPDERTKGRAAAEVVRASTAFRAQPWRVLRLARETLPDQVWRGKAARGVAVERGGLVGGDVLAALGQQRRDGRGEVLPVQCAGRRFGGGAGAGGVPPRRGGAQLPGVQVGAGLHALRGAKLHGAAAPPEPVPGGAGVRGRTSAAAAGGKRWNRRPSRCAGRCRSYPGNGCGGSGGPTSGRVSWPSSRTISGVTERRGSPGGNGRSS